MKWLLGYLTKWGNKNVICTDIPGPASYTTGGFTVLASSLGIGGIDWIGAGGAISGNYFAVGTPIGAGTQPSYNVQVFVSSTGAEAGAETELDGETFRLIIVGM
jgi:hypothetical protein